MTFKPQINWTVCTMLTMFSNVIQILNWTRSQPVFRRECLRGKEIFSWRGGGVRLQSLQTNFTAVQASSTSDPSGEGWSDCNHCRPISRQSKFNFWSVGGGGGGFWLQSLQTWIWNTVKWSAGIAVRHPPPTEVRPDCSPSSYQHWL